MRILASNPDTLGDFVLRQPMYQSWLDAGHHLALVVTPLVEPLARRLFPAADLLAVDAPLYAPALHPDGPDLDAVARAAKDLAPDAFVAAPFQRTRLEERLATTLAGTKTFGFTGVVASDPAYGPPPPSSFHADVKLDVPEAAPELEKNARLAAAVLGRPLTLPDPRLTAPTDAEDPARQVLAGLGWEPGSYWAACVGHSQWTAVRNWPLDRWAATLARWARAHGRRFLLVGHEREAFVSRDVIARMGDQGHHAAVWSGSEPADVLTLTALLAHARGYVGRDTGPMHLAAALGKPVLAVFGGGTWPRFLPAATPSVSLAVRLGCFGCGWRCELADSHCIKAVPQAEVDDAADALETGRTTTRDVRLLDPGPALADQALHEAAASAKRRLVSLAVARRDARPAEPPAEGDLAALRADVEAHRRRAEERLAALTATTREQAQRLASLEAAAAQAHARSQADADALRVQLAQLTEQLEAQRALTAAAEAQSAALRAELTQARALVADHRDEIDRRDAMVRRSADQVAATAALLRQHEKDLARARADLASLREQVTALGRQREELLASRWRRYGQRLGLVMTLPWEREQPQNGQHP